MENLSAARRRHVVWFWSGLVALVALIAFLAWSPAVQGAVNQAIAWARDVMNGHPVLGRLVFFLFSALSAMLAFASSAILVPPANLVWGESMTFVLLWGGWLLGAVAAFGIGRLARPLLVHTGYEDKLEKYQEYVSRRMRFWAVLLFCLAVPSEIPGYLFGSMRYPFAKFLPAVAIAEAGYALGVVVAGENLLVDRPWPFLATIAALAVIAAVAGLALRRLKRRGPASVPPGTWRNH